MRRGTKSIRWRQQLGGAAAARSRLVSIPAACPARRSLPVATTWRRVAGEARPGTMAMAMARTTARATVGMEDWGRAATLTLAEERSQRESRSKDLICSYASRIFCRGWGYPRERGDPMRACVVIGDELSWSYRPSSLPKALRRPAGGTAHSSGKAAAWAVVQSPFGWEW